MELVVLDSFVLRLFGALVFLERSRKGEATGEKLTAVRGRGERGSERERASEREAEEAVSFLPRSRDVRVFLKN